MSGRRGSRETAAEDQAVRHTERSITELLVQRHAKDVFVAGCALGSRQLGAKELDGWALLRTWSPVTTVGYEIKVARSDWLRDQKVPTYQRTVHLMYVVAPKGVVQALELPAGCGLLEVSSTGHHLLTRVKPVRHENPDNGPLLLYVLMSRTRIVDDMHEANGPNRDAAVALWRGFVEGRCDRKVLGIAASRRVAEELRKATAEAHAARFECDLFRPVAEAMAELLGEPVERIKAMGSWWLVQRLREVTGQKVTDDVSKALQRARAVRTYARKLVADIDRAIGVEEVVGG